MMVGGCLCAVKYGARIILMLCVNHLDMGMIIRVYFFLNLIFKKNDIILASYLFYIYLKCHNPMRYEFNTRCRMWESQVIPVSLSL